MHAEGGYELPVSPDLPSLRWGPNLPAPQNVTDRAFEEGVKLKWGHESVS